MRKILMLGLCSIINPISGGQIRVSEIFKKYNLSGFNVKYIGLYDKLTTNFVDNNSIDVPIPKQFLGVPSCIVGNIATGIEVATNESIFKQLTSDIENFAPDYIQLEQPWLWPYYKRLKQVLQNKMPPLVYSSQNIEYITKQQILEKQGYSNFSYESIKIINEIKTIEKEICQEAELSIATSEHDAEILKTFGAKKVIIVPNSTTIVISNHKKLLYWSKKIGFKKNTIFVGSAYPPNVDGFHNLLSPLGFLGPNEKLVLVGGIGQAILNTDHGIFRDLNLDRIINLGILAHEDLSAVLTLATVIVLPIQIGGGTNLKTPEALLYGKNVVGTNKAFRGFEKYKKEKFVTVADSSADFKVAIRNYLDHGESELDLEKKKQAYPELLWDNALEKLIKYWRVK